MGARDEASFEIEVKWLPHATCEPEMISDLASSRQRYGDCHFGQRGSNAELQFEVKARSGSAPTVAMPERVGIVLDASARTAEGLYASIAPELVERIAASIEPGAVETITSWPAPYEIDLPWGLGFDGNVDLRPNGQEGSPRDTGRRSHRNDIQHALGRIVAGRHGV